MFILNRVKTRAQIERDPRILCEDDFRNGPQGWVPLISSASPQGALCLDSEITFNGSGYSLFLATDDYVDGAGVSNWASCTAMKRLPRGNSMGKIRAEFVYAVGAQYGGVGEQALAPRMIQFGLDTADMTGARRYFSFRYLVGASGAVQQKFQVLHTDGSTYADVPGASKVLAVNENKRDLARVEIEVDLATSKYTGLRVNGDGFGSLAATPDTTISALPSPQAETLASFSGGLNPVFAIRNRNDSASTRCWANLCYVKVTAL